MVGWLGIPIIIACLASLWVIFRFISRRSTTRLLREVKTQLLGHLKSIGVRAELQKGENSEIRRREEGYRVRLRQLAGVRVWLTRIQSIEVWRETRKRESNSVTEDEITYVVAFEPGITLSRIPILTNMVRMETAGGKTRFQWRGFQWGRLPLLVDRLRADRSLNRRLRNYYSQDVVDDLRVRALSSKGVGITTSYNRQKLPSREFLNCIEDIAQHVNDYVAERNSEREEDSLPAEITRMTG